MKNFIKENWFKAGLLIIAIIALAFYLLLWQPAQEKRETLSNNIKCQQEGSQLFEKEQKAQKEKDRIIKRVFKEPEFRFNNELNTCLYQGAWTDLGASGDHIFYFIKDVYTNKTLASYNILIHTKEKKQPDIFGNEEEYERLRVKYFTK